MLRRLHIFHDLTPEPECDRFLRSLDPHKRVRFGALLAQLRAFREEVLSGVQPRRR